MTQPSDVLAEASRWIGTTEQPRGSNNVPGITDWYPMVGAWCAMFVSRVFWNAGLPLPASTEHGFAWCSAGADWFRAQGATRPSRDAEPGDVVFMEWGSTPGGYDHVGICQENTGAGLVCVEGNIGDRVGVFSRTYGEVPEVGRPAWTPAPPPPTRKVPPMIDLMTLPDGRLVQFRAFPNGIVLHRWQAVPGGGWKDWQSLPTQPGSFDAVAATANADGRMELIAWHSAFGVPFQTWQTAPGGLWSPWTQIP